MLESRFAYGVEVHRGRALLASTAASMLPLVEDVYFRAVLTGAFPNDGVMPPLAIVPVWHQSGRPNVAALTVSTGGRAVGSYDRGVFAWLARVLIATLVQSKRLRESDRVAWHLVATERPAPPQRVRGRAARAPYPFREGSLPGAARGSFTVVFQASVLDDIRHALIDSPRVERAGLLTGHLVRDADRGAAELRVDGQIPVAAGRGGASEVHFSFDAASFLAARRSLAQARDRRIATGWLHTHPPCEHCPQRTDCRAETVFFSELDVRVHATAFPAAYQVALVAGKLRAQRAGDPGFRLYSWARGEITERALLLAPVYGATEAPVRERAPAVEDVA